MEINGITLTESQSVQDKPIRVLLVDDQPIIAEAIRRMLDSERDVAFFYCQNPMQAMSVATQFKPTVILQDLVMPDVDGLTLVKYFRANPATKNMPLVVLSSKEDANTKYKAFENGANDYMVKLPDKLEVLARIRYHSNAYITLCQKNEAMENLQKSQLHLRQELEQAEQYVEGLLPKKLDNEFVKTNWIFKSSNELGGDCFGYEWIDKENFGMYLLDVCGHGVGAALLSVSVMNVLRTQSLPDVDFKKPAQVLMALNNAFDMDKQNNMYFTLWYGVFNASTRELTYASGGHPPAILSVKKKISELTTNGMIIGGIPDMKYSEKSLKLENDCALYIFSDGVYEIENAQTKEIMGYEDFKKSLVEKIQNDGTTLESLLKDAELAQNSKQFSDDYSICEIKFK